MSDLFDTINRMDKIIELHGQIGKLIDEQRESGTTSQFLPHDEWFKFLGAFDEGDEQLEAIWKYLKP